MTSTLEYALGGGCSLNVRCSMSLERGSWRRIPQSRECPVGVFGAVSPRRAPGQDANFLMRPLYRPSTAAATDDRGRASPGRSRRTAPARSGQVESMIKEAGLGLLEGAS